MPKLRIPDRYKPGIAAIGKLDDSAILKIHEAIKHVASPSEAGTIGSLLTALLSDINVENHEQVADAIASLYRVKGVRDAPIEDFVDAICAGMEVKGTEYDKLKSNLVTLLGVEEVGVISKAWTLQSENERVFCHGRIITDLRPVFGPDITQGPKAMVITHFLKLGYHRQLGEDSHEDVYVSLDAEDLDTLQEMIDRAKAKAKILKASIKNFTYMARS